MNRIGIERLCVFGMPPVEFVELAAGLECDAIGIGLTAMRGCNPHGYADWTLRNPETLQETRAALADRGVAISLLEGFTIMPDRDPLDQLADLDLAAELGARRINLVSMERDFARNCAGFAAMAEEAQARGIAVSTEIGTGPVRTLEKGLRLIEAVAHPNLTLLIDTMHFFRLGSSLDQLGQVPGGLIGYVQLCDAPLRSLNPDYMDEALHERLVPGEGELPLQALLALVPPQVTISLEVPRRSLAEAGIDAAARVAPCVAAARAMLQDKG